MRYRAESKVSLKFFFYVQSYRHYDYLSLCTLYYTTIMHVLYHASKWVRYFIRFSLSRFIYIKSIYFFFFGSSSVWENNITTVFRPTQIDSP